MRLEDYLKMYQRWSDAELIDNYRNRHEFEKGAIVAMEKMMMARGFGDQVVQRPADVAIPSQPRPLPPGMDEQQLAYEIATFGDLISDVDYARNARQANGVYLAGNLTTGSSTMAANTLLILGVLGLASIVILEAYGMRNMRVMVGLAAISVLLIIAGIVLRMMNRHSYKLYEDANGKLIFEIFGKHADRFEAPLHYQFAADEDDSERISKWTLSFYLEDNRKAILCSELKSGAFLSEAPNWPPLSALRGQSYPQEFHAGGLKAMDTRRLKKILDGLSKAAH